MERERRPVNKNTCKRLFGDILTTLVIDPDTPVDSFYVPRYGSEKFKTCADFAVITKDKQEILFYVASSMSSSNFRHILKGNHVHLFHMHHKETTILKTDEEIGQEILQRILNSEFN